MIAGQWLRTVDPVSGQLRHGRVKSVQPRLAPKIHTLFTECGETLQASPSHLLIAGFGDRYGRPLASFAIGDEILVAVEENRIVPSRLSVITTIDMPQPVLGIEMDTWEHTLITGGLVSHNLQPKERDQSRTAK